MPITSRSEYGMRAMILLATQLGDDLLSATELSRREHIPLKYLEQILAELKRSGLVQSQAGARGGYRLSRPPAEIPVGAIITALDGPLAPMSCVESGTRPACEFEANCRLRPLWVRLYQAIHGVLDNTMLDELNRETVKALADGPQPPRALDAADDDARPAPCQPSWLL